MNIDEPKREKKRNRCGLSPENAPAHRGWRNEEESACIRRSSHQKKSRQMEGPETKRWGVTRKSRWSGIPDTAARTSKMVTKK